MNWPGLLFGLSLALTLVGSAGAAFAQGARHAVVIAVPTTFGVVDTQRTAMHATPIGVAGVPGHGGGDLQRDPGPPHSGAIRTTGAGEGRAWESACHSASRAAS